MKFRNSLEKFKIRWRFFRLEISIRMLFPDEENPPMMWGIKLSALLVKIPSDEVKKFKYFQAAKALWKYSELALKIELRKSQSDQAFHLIGPARIAANFLFRYYLVEDKHKKAHAAIDNLVWLANLLHPEKRGKITVPELNPDQLPDFDDVTKTLQKLFPDISHEASGPVSMIADKFKEWAKSVPDEHRKNPLLKAYYEMFFDIASNQTILLQTFPEIDGWEIANKAIGLLDQLSENSGGIPEYTEYNERVQDEKVLLKLFAITHHKSFDCSVAIDWRFFSHLEQDPTNNERLSTALEAAKYVKRLRSIEESDLDAPPIKNLVNFISEIDRGDWSDEENLFICLIGYRCFSKIFMLAWQVRDKGFLSIAFTAHKTLSLQLALLGHEIPSLDALKVSCAIHRDIVLFHSLGYREEMAEDLLFFDDDEKPDETQDQALDRLYFDALCDANRFLKAVCHKEDVGEVMPLIDDIQHKLHRLEHSMDNPNGNFLEDTMFSILAKGSEGKISEAQLRTELQSQLVKTFTGKDSLDEALDELIQEASESELFEEPENVLPLLQGKILMLLEKKPDQEFTAKLDTLLDEVEHQIGALIDNSDKVVQGSSYMYAANCYWFVCYIPYKGKSLITDTQIRSYACRAEHFFEKALEIRTKEFSPKQYALAHHTMARLLSKVYGELECEESLSKLKKAQYSYKEALETLSDTNWPTIRLDCAKQLLLLHFRFQNYDEVKSHANFIYDYVDEHLWEMISIHEQKVLLDALNHTGDILASVLISEGKYLDALVACEGARSKLWKLSVLLSSLVEQADSDDLKESLQEAEKHRLQYQDEKSEQNKSLETFQKKSALFGRLSGDNKFLKAALQDFIEPPDDKGKVIKEFLNSSRQYETVIICSVSDETFAFVIPHDASMITDDMIIRFYSGRSEHTESKLQSKISKNWHNNLAQFKSSLENEDEATLCKACAEWNSFVSHSLEVMHDEIMNKIEIKLRDLGVKQGAEVKFLTTGLTEALPIFHAGKRTGDKYWDCFSDRWKCSSVPNLTYLVNSFDDRCKPAKQNGILLVVDDELDSSLLDKWQPTSKPDYVTILPWETATVEQVKKELQGCDLAIFLGHFEAHPLDAYKSGFCLIDGYLGISVLSGFEMQNAPTIILGACESAQIDQLDLPYELNGLSYGLLQAGASQVFATYWPVTLENIEYIIEKVIEDYFSQSEFDLTLSLHNLRSRNMDVDADTKNYQNIIDDLNQPINWAAFKMLG
jgi:hypothetical protein